MSVSRRHACMALAAATLTAGCTANRTGASDQAGPGNDTRSGTDQLAQPTPGVTPPARVRILPASTAPMAAVQASAALLESTSDLILSDVATVAQAARAAAGAKLPILLVAAGAGAKQVAAEAKRLQPQRIHWYGGSARQLAQQTFPTTQLHAGTAVVRPLEAAVNATQTGVTLLSSIGAADTVLTAIAAASGNRVVSVPGGDPRASAASVHAVAPLQDASVLAIGTGFGTTALLTDRLVTAMAGEQLIGGGQLWFAGRRYVAMYGHPGSPRLGILGEQGVDASVKRVKSLAAQYEKLSKERVVPMFEIIATVAIGSPGPNGTYSARWPVAKFQPWVDAARKNAIAVVLDLQPGTERLLDQAKVYESLLSQPNVGLALDPEWKLAPGQKPLKQIGQVDVSEVNEVIRWLADLTRRNHLPQKALVLHQFQTRMILHRDRLDLSHDELAICIHADGQGGQGAKQGTWRALRQGAQSQLHWGWKNFYDEDKPMLTPGQTMRVSPVPVLISYQ